MTDFVVTWVDSSDPAWRAAYCAARPDAPAADELRYREWGLFRYWFRAVERYAPWVRRIHLVTCGQRPAWLRADHPKLHLVAHADFMPAEALPTFASPAIEFCLDRIPGLAEQFVNFNDDVYLNAPVAEDWYFRRGLPCAAPHEKPLTRCYWWGPQERYAILLNEVVNMALLNACHSRRQAVRQSPRRWLSCYQGPLQQVVSWVLCLQGSFTGFRLLHAERPMLRQTFREVWQALPDPCAETVSHRFRQDADPNIFLFDHWQLATNRFYPLDRFRHTAEFGLAPHNKARIAAALANPGFYSVCLNDAPLSAADYADMRAFVLAEMERKFPQKSSYEC